MTPYNLDETQAKEGDTLSDTDKERIDEIIAFLRETNDFWSISRG